MMKVIYAAVLALSLGLYLPAVFAGKTGKGTVDVEIERPDEILTETDTFLSVPIHDRQPGSGKTLRCWQYGRLLYEGKGFNHLASSEKTVVSVDRQKGEAVSIISLQDGLCILSDR
jgi:hypothetical protein